LWRFSWILSFSALMSIVFMMVNLLKPEIHNQVLMPALQSPWFIPHVTVYIFSYALLGCSFLLALAALIKPALNLDKAIGHLVIAGISCFSLGMLFGALWAKEAWGNYWSWDPKETWAAITWILYLLYIHLIRFRYRNKKIVYLVLIFAFCALQMCWYGINYLPAAQQSIHVY
ncbi:MAG: cytochrome c biogenesis protein CcsA, partial [Bacteroidales bacterium]|nr:cytochrome c biogenesis protein CcsA [Bacteroidales bacterium]